MQKISEQIKQKVKELKEQNYTYSQISEMLSIGKGSVSNICKELGITKQPIQLTSEKIKELQELYNKLGNIKKVAKISGISYDRLREVIISKTITPKKSYTCVKDWRHKAKQILVDYKGGKCCICGYDKCNEALDFHHLNPENKDFSISSTHKNIDILKKEVDKCILVCCRCHREIHAGLIDLDSFNNS